jgi:hypothetical protein
MLCGYAGAWLSRRQRTVPDDVVAFLRREQLQRLKASLLHGRRNRS